MLSKHRTNTPLIQPNLTAFESDPSSASSPAFCITILPF